MRIQVPRPGGRLDHVLVEQVADLSRTRLQRLVHQGLVSIDGVVETKAGRMLHGGETVFLTVPDAAPADLEPESIPLDIVFENEHLMVVNKPSGMVVHPSPGHGHSTLVHAVLALAPDIAGVGGELRPGVVHRLDKETSGLILLAKNDAAHQALQREFKQRSVEKVYLALVDGSPPTPSGRVEAAIGRDVRRRRLMGVVRDGKGREAITDYNTVERFTRHTLLEVRPRTGRTHQIRVHLAFLGCPVAGDRVYGHRRPTIPLERHFLHACLIRLRLPGQKEASTFEAPLPRELASVLDDLRHGSQ